MKRRFGVEPRSLTDAQRASAEPPASPPSRVIANARAAGFDLNAEAWSAPRQRRTLRADENGRRRNAKPQSRRRAEGIRSAPRPRELTVSRAHRAAPAPSASVTRADAIRKMSVWARPFVTYLTLRTTSPIKATSTIGPTVKLKHKNSARQQLERTNRSPGTKPCSNASATRNIAGTERAVTIVSEHIRRHYQYADRKCCSFQ